MMNEQTKHARAAFTLKTGIEPLSFSKGDGSMKPYYRVHVPLSNALARAFVEQFYQTQNKRSFCGIKVDFISVFNRGAPQHYSVWDVKKTELDEKPLKHGPEPEKSKRGDPPAQPDDDQMIELAYDMVERMDHEELVEWAVNEMHKGYMENRDWFPADWEMLRKEGR